MKRKNDKLIQPKPFVNDVSAILRSKEISNAPVDWKDGTSVLQYTEKLLLEKFQLSVSLLPDRLCPPIPNRLNYLSWLNQLLQLDPLTHFEVRVLDVGTGASCIYPLLGHKLYGWKFLASDIDLTSIQQVKFNLDRNPTSQDSIHPILVCPSDTIQSILVNDYVIKIESKCDNLPTLNQFLLNICRIELNKGTTMSEIFTATRGPIRTALFESTSRNIVLICEENFFQPNLNYPQIAIPSNNNAEGKLEPLLHFTMSNPPFYDETEEVSHRVVTIYCLTFFIHESFRTIANLKP